jgi:hypothetical protein
MKNPTIPTMYSISTRLLLLPIRYNGIIFNDAIRAILNIYSKKGIRDFIIDNAKKFTIVTNRFREMFKN